MTADGAQMAIPSTVQEARLKPGKNPKGKKASIFNLRGLDKGAKAVGPGDLHGELGLVPVEGLQLLLQHLRLAHPHTGFQHRAQQALVHLETKTTQELPGQAIQLDWTIAYGAYPWFQKSLLRRQPVL